MKGAKGMKKSAWRHFTNLLVIIVACNLITACGMIAIHVINNSYESLAGTRKEAKYAGAPFKKIIVIGLTNDVPTRIAFENAFMGQFIGQGVSAVTGSMNLPDANALKNKSQVENAIDNGSCDGVVTVEVKNVAAGETSQWLKAWRATPVPGRDELFAVLANADKSRPIPSENIRFEVMLWNGKTTRQVWVGITKEVDKHEILREAHTAAHSTVRTLTDAGLLKSTL